jgi:hypothetical protein
MKKYTNGTRVPKKPPAKYFRSLIARGFGGLKARQPKVQGMVATRYEIMKMSCQSWSSVDVMYVQPPHVSVLKMPKPATTLGNVLPGLAVNRYHRPTRANLGPEVIAIKSINADRSGYRSPIVADTEGNHSCG